MGWFEGYQSEHDEAVLDAIPADEGGDEWVWESANICCRNEIQKACRASSSLLAEKPLA